MIMRDSLRVFAIVAQAALLFTAPYSLLTFISIWILSPPGAWSALMRHIPSAIQAITLAIILLVPIVLAASWLFRKLRFQYSQRDARGAAIAFAVACPISLVIGLLLGPLTGGYTEALLGSRFALFGAFFGVFVLTALLTFLPTIVVLRSKRRAGVVSLLFLLAACVNPPIIRAQTKSQ